MQALA